MAPTHIMNWHVHEWIGPDRPHISWWQMSIRAVMVFAFGLVLIRLFGRRAFAKQTPLDIVIAIMIGSNLSRALTGNASFSDADRHGGHRRLVLAAGTRRGAMAGI